MQFSVDAPAGQKRGNASGQGVSLAGQRAKSGFHARALVVPALPDFAVLPWHRSAALFHRLARLRSHLGPEARLGKAAGFQEQAQQLSFHRASVEGVQPAVKSHAQRAGHVEILARQHAGDALHPQTHHQDVSGHSRFGESRENGGFGDYGGQVLRRYVFFAVKRV